MSIERLTPDGRAGSQGREPHARWEIDGDKSPLEFTLRHLVISEIKGRFHRWGGTLVIDRDEPGRSHLSAWVDLASIDTGDPERDEQVKSPEFLEVKRFPRARFITTALHPSDAGVLLRGRLDMHGVVRVIEIQVMPWVAAKTPEGSGRALYEIKATIDRQSFGLHWNQDLDAGGVVVGDKIDLRARVEMTPALESDAGPSPH